MLFGGERGERACRRVHCTSEPTCLEQDVAEMGPVCPVLVVV